MSNFDECSHGQYPLLQSSQSMQQAPLHNQMSLESTGDLKQEKYICVLIVMIVMIVKHVTQGDVIVLIQ